MNALSSGNPPSGQPPLSDGGFPDVPVVVPVPLETLPYFKTFEEIQAIPGYKPNVDPKTTRIARLRGIYSGLRAEVPCGLTRCHQGHLTGVVVETIDGDVTNIGHVCGGRYFEEFQQKKNEYDTRVEHSRRLRVLKDFLNAEPITRQRIETIRRDSLGADWLHTSYKSFFSGVPSEVVNVLRERARRDETRVTHAERVTNEEEAERIRQFQSGLSRQRNAKDPLFIERELGHLRGLRIWKDGQTVRDLLYEGVVARLDVLCGLDLPQLRSHALRDWADWAESVDMRLDEVNALVLAGREFFKDDNLALIGRMTWGRTTSDALRTLKWDYAAGIPRSAVRIARPR